MLFRYPGGKSKVCKVIANAILAALEARPDFGYIEPFFGAGAVGFEVLRGVPGLGRPGSSQGGFWFNDGDPAIAMVWNAVWRDTEELKARLASFVPSVGAYREFKEHLLETTSDESDPVRVAFEKIAIHSMSYSGLGTKSGGPIGGLKQEGKYDVGCRYSLKSFNRLIDQVCSLLEGRLRPDEYVCSGLDFGDVVGADWEAVIYLDPPYYDKGPELYQRSFTDEDHVRLAESLRKTSNPWLLSYDDHARVRSLYEGWADIGTIDLTYTINAHGGGVRKQELLIRSVNFGG